MKIILISLFAGALFILSACNCSGPANNSELGGQKNSDSTPLNTNESSKMEKDSTFLVTAYGIGTFEIEVGKLAEKNSKDMGVKSFAKLMMSEHAGMNNDIASLALKRNINLSNDLIGDMQSKFDKLQGLTGKDFDQLYVDINVKGHTDAISLFEVVSNDDYSADVRDLAVNALPRLRMHKEHAESLQGKVGSLPM